MSEDNKMNPEVKAKWVAALRSGEYKQGKLNLRRGTSRGTEHCCLGVLAEVFEPESLGRGEGYDACARARVSDDQMYTLYSMNDRENKSFDEIADYIEANL